MSIPSFNPDSLESPEFVKDNFWNDLPANFTSQDEAELLIHRINIFRPTGRIDSITGAKLQGTAGDDFELIAKDVPCLVEEKGATETEKFARRGVICSHQIYLGKDSVEVDIDYIIKYEADRIFRVVYGWDEAGQDQNVMPTIQVKEL